MRLSSTLHRSNLLLREGRGAEREGGRALGNRRTRTADYEQGTHSMKPSHPQPKLGGSNVSKVAVSLFRGLPNRAGWFLVTSTHSRIPHGCRPRRVGLHEHAKRRVRRRCR